jgi:tRNA dimethylallyltransferase
MSIDAVLIAGPTASGKSAAALALAREFGGAVINADSMQVYRELRIVSARPSEDDERQAPHFLYGFAPLAEGFTVAKWLDAARVALLTCREQGLLPIIVGGTGLYFSALTQGLAPIPEIHASIRAEARELLASIGAERLHALLADHDPDMAARLVPNDGQRIVRAWEVVEATGQSLAEWQEVKGEPLLPGKHLAFVLKPNREWLYANIERRFDAMMARGALAEAARVKSLNLSQDLPGMKALGLRELIDYLDGKITVEAAIVSAKMKTRRYAKRQMTWFRHQMPEWHGIEEQETEQVVAAIANELRFD